MTVVRPRVDLTDSAFPIDRAILSEAFDRMSEDPWSTYPPSSPSSAETALGHRWGIEAGRIVLTPGADGAVDLVFRRAIRSGVVLRYPSPSYPGFERAASRHGGTGLGYDALSTFDEDLVEGQQLLWGYPANPLGPEGLPAEDTKPRTTLDATYLSPFGDPLVEVLRAGWETIFSFSKTSALAGARIGGLVARDTSQAADLRNGSPTFPLSTFQLRLIEVLTSAHGVEASRDVTRRLESAAHDLTVAASRLGLTVVAKTSNFVTVRLSSDIEADRLGVRVWALGGRCKHFPDSGLLRISSAPENVRALELIRRSPETSPLRT